MMDWTKLLTSERLCGKLSRVERSCARNPFESDIDRITFSTPFRRLAKKTQVHPFAENDHIHNRLTHSLEVARVGFSLGATACNMIRDQDLSPPLPDNIRASEIGTIVQAACLAHDLGNPPFGHAGEAAMSHWLKETSSIYGDLRQDLQDDVKYVEGNAQGFRILTQTHNYLFDGGLRLTFATLATFQKYPWISSERNSKNKFGAYITEEEILYKVAEATGLKKVGNKWCRHPLAFLVEAADDICYSILDLEDAVEIGAIRFKEVRDLFFTVLDDEFKESICDEFGDSNEQFRLQFTRIRGPLFDKLITEACQVFISKYTEILLGEFEGELLSKKHSKTGELVFNAKQLAKTFAFVHSKKVEIELGAYSIVETLLENFSTAALAKSRLLGDSSQDLDVPWKHLRMLDIFGNHAPSKDNAPPSGKWTEHECLRRVIDFITGMTDDFATHLALRLRGIPPN